MKKQLTRGNNFSFSAGNGFSGSCGGTPVKGYMRGGSVKKSTPAPYAKGGAITPSDKEHKDYDDSKAKDGAVYPEAGTASKPEGYKKGGVKKAKGGGIGQPYEAAKKGGPIKKAKGGALPYAHGGRMPGAVAGAKHRAKGPGARGGMGKVPMAGPLMGGQMAAAPAPAPPPGVGGGMPQAPMMAKGGKR